MEPLHRLWLGYISELLGLPLRNATSANQIVAQAGGAAVTDEGTPDFRPESQHARTMSAMEDGISLTKMQGWQAKLVKADFHGCKIEGSAVCRTEMDIWADDRLSETGKTSFPCRSGWHSCTRD